MLPDGLDVEKSAHGLASHRALRSPGNAARGWRPSMAYQPPRPAHDTAARPGAAGQADAVSRKVVRIGLKDCAARGADGPTTRVPRALSSLRHIAGLLSKWRTRISDRRILSMLDAHMLHDIGLARETVDRLRKTPFWRD
jgi:uncharacterized protein YjiS (DUF1127 family)